MGSASYGTYVPKEDPDSIDDVDIMAIVVPSGKWLIGLHRIECLETGELMSIARPMLDEIRAIKRGLWTLDQVKDELDRLAGRIAVARDDSRLPAEPDTALAETLLIEITESIWSQSA